MAGNLIARSIHDLGAAAWFGGSLMGAIGLNGAADKAKAPAERTRLSSIGWAKWAPVQGVALGAHLLAGTSIIWENKGRMLKQHGVQRLSIYKTIVTLTGAGVTAYSGVLGMKVAKLSNEGGEAATEPHSRASAELADAQKKLKAVQWLVPAFAGWVIVLGAKHGEMQRPINVAKGLAKR